MRRGVTVSLTHPPLPGPWAEADRGARLRTVSIAVPALRVRVTGVRSAISARRARWCSSSSAVQWMIRSIRSLRSGPSVLRNRRARTAQLAELPPFPAGIHPEGGRGALHQRGQQQLVGVGPTVLAADRPSFVGHEVVSTGAHLAAVSLDIHHVDRGERLLAIRIPHRFVHRTFVAPNRDPGALSRRSPPCESGGVGTITGMNGRSLSDRAGSRRPFPWLNTDTWIMIAAVVAPVAVAVALTPWRSRSDTADNALILVVVIVAVASTGRRPAAAVSALAAALSFDFFLTRPYQSLRISRNSDLVTETLLLVVGLSVGELAARGRRHRDAASNSRQQVAQLHRITELAATGSDPDSVALAAASELRTLLSLRSCRFTRRLPEGLTAKIAPDGKVIIGTETWSTGTLGLPTRMVDLPVRGGGWVLGHFLLDPTPGRARPPGGPHVAVAIADQVGAAAAAEESAAGGPGRC